MLVYGLKGVCGVLVVLENCFSCEVFDVYVEVCDLFWEFLGVCGFGFIERVVCCDLDVFVVVC